MTITILTFLMKGIAYTLIFYGLWLMIGEEFYNFYVKQGINYYKYKRRIKRLQELDKEKKDEPKKNNVLINHLEILLLSTRKSKNPSVSNFIMLSIILFIVATITLYFIIDDLIISLIIGILFGLFPYIITRYRLEMIRSKTQFAFMEEYHKIIQNYQSTNKNIYYTLLNTSNELSDKHIRQQFFKLISAFQKDRNIDEFKKSVHVFIFSINSTFAKRFGNLIIKAHLDNADIGGSLIDLNEDITQRKKGIDEEKSKNLQTVMLGFAPIITIPLMMYFAYQFTGVRDFWFYFMKPTSFFIFIICIILSVISILLANLLRKPKADI